MNPVITTIPIDVFQTEAIHPLGEHSIHQVSPNWHGHNTMVITQWSAWRQKASGFPSIPADTSISLHLSILSFAPLIFSRQSVKSSPKYKVVMTLPIISCTAPLLSVQTSSALFPMPRYNSCRIYTIQ